MWEKCNSIWFYLLYLFIQYLILICIHGPAYGDSRGIAGVRCWTITFWLSPMCRGSAGFTTLGHLPCWDFLLCRVGQKAGLLPSACPHRAGLIPGLWKVKIIIPAYPRRWGSSGYKWRCANSCNGVLVCVKLFQLNCCAELLSVIAK